MADVKYRKAYTVGELKKVLEEYPDDKKILVGKDPGHRELPIEHVQVHSGVVVLYISDVAWS